MSVLVEGFRGFARYLGGVMGADAYQKYLEHHDASGHLSQPMTEREF